MIAASDPGQIPAYEREKKNELSSHESYADLGIRISGTIDSISLIHKPIKIRFDFLIISPDRSTLLALKKSARMLTSGVQELSFAFGRFLLGIRGSPDSWILAFCVECKTGNQAERERLRSVLELAQSGFSQDSSRSLVDSSRAGYNNTASVSE